MEKHISILRQAALKNLPDPVDEHSGINLEVFKALYEDGCNKETDTSSSSRQSYSIPRITLAERS